MMECTKENAMTHALVVARNSWTFERMTEEEKTRCILAMTDTRTKDAAKGSFQQRYAVYMAVYGAFLDGIGYNGPFWREAVTAC